MIEPLKKRIMTLSQLQLRTLATLRKVRRQFNRMPYEDGMSDREFLDKVLAPLEIEIRQDREMLKMRRSMEPQSYCKPG